MGRVFTWKEVEKGLVPNMTAFAQVNNSLRARLVKEEGVVGAVVCGSVQHREHSIRSDIDVVVLYRPEGRESVFKAMNEASLNAFDSHVPIEFIPIRLGSQHNIGRSFLAHIAAAIENGGLVKENPVPLLDQPSDDTREYLIRKIGKLEAKMGIIDTTDEPELHRLYQKILEAPVHAGRKLLIAKGVSLNRDDRKSVFGHLNEVAGKSQIQLLERVIEVDNLYTNTLHRQFLTPNQREYVRVLQEIHDTAWTAIEFVRGCLEQCP